MYPGVWLPWLGWGWLLPRCVAAVARAGVVCAQACGCHDGLFPDAFFVPTGAHLLPLVKAAVVAAA